MCIRDRPTKEPLVTLNCSQSIADAFTALADANILSAPVLLGSGFEQRRDEYLGMVDTAQLLQHTVKAWRRKHRFNRWDATVIAAAGRDLFATKLIKVTGHDTGFAHPAAHDRSLGELIQTCFLRADGKQQAHRVILMDDRGRYHAVFSQSDVLRFVAAHLGACLPVADGLLEHRLKDINYLGVGDAPRRVETALNIQPAIEAFEAMYDAGVSALAVVDTDGTLVGNLSGSDLRGMREAEFVRLLLPVKDYLKSYSKQV
eukprot:TRINITY_DN1318_c0_g1_i4.p1 TRINITY_DN1318_c0_g1~~TRINITY_DN1318_c0_g1_i4.p1  ORF type:complete len:259 (-),score=59.75 TRINITY_DN1318_c0_g1_i4:474-1250(-)